MKNLNQRGVSQLLILLAVVVVAAVGVVGYRVMNDKDTTTTVKSTTTVIKQENVPSTIKSSADVNKATQALDQTNVDSVNPDQLDTEITSVL